MNVLCSRTFMRSEYKLAEDFVWTLRMHGIQAKIKFAPFTYVVLFMIDGDLLGWDIDENTPS